MKMRQERIGWFVRMDGASGGGGLRKVERDIEESVDSGGCLSGWRLHQLTRIERS